MQDCESVSVVQSDLVVYIEGEIKMDETSELSDFRDSQLGS